MSQDTVNEPINRLSELYTLAETERRKVEIFSQLAVNACNAVVQLTQHVQQLPPSILKTTAEMLGDDIIKLQQQNQQFALEFAKKAEAATTPVYPMVEPLVVAPVEN